jgi:pimeloyl-ACP methyl ester carboxylesterase
MEERRKPILGRVVPGVTPDLQRRLRRFFAVVQMFSPRLAAALALRIFSTPPRRKMETGDEPIVALAQKTRMRTGSDEFTVLQWPNNGPRVVLLHGWGSHAARFANFVAPLREAGFAVIAIDAPAHGESPGRRAGMPNFRNSLYAVLAAHEPIHAVIGHSLGGGAALTVLAETADHHPKKLCLFGVPGDMDYILESFAMMLGLKPAALAQMRAQFAAYFGRTAKSIATMAAAPSVRIPLLVVHDEDDAVAPFSAGQALVAAVPGARMLSTHGLGHSGALRDAAVIEQVLSFLRE